MLESRVGGEDRVVGFDDRARQLRSRIHAKLKFGLLSIICRQTLEQQRAEAGASSSTKRVEDEKSLETRAVIGKAPDLVHDRVNQLLSYGVVAASI
jgi:hypothetical protein